MKKRLKKVLTKGKRYGILIKRFSREREFLKKEIKKVLTKRFICDNIIDLRVRYEAKRAAQKKVTEKQKK